MTASFVSNLHSGMWSASAVYDDESFAYVQAGDSRLWNHRGLLCVDEGNGPTPSNPINLFDDGLGGDDVAGDGMYTRSCITICPNTLSSNNVLEECINCGGDGSRLLGILSASLRGKITSHVAHDHSPHNHPGCDSVTFTSHGIFAVCPQLMPTFPQVNAWAIQAPNQCTPCRKAMDHFGEAFDFLLIARPCQAEWCGGDNYIRVRGYSIWHWIPWASYKHGSMEYGCKRVYTTDTSARYRMGAVREWLYA